MPLDSFNNAIKLAKAGRTVEFRGGLFSQLEHEWTCIVRVPLSDSISPLSVPKSNYFFSPSGIKVLLYDDQEILSWYRLKEDVPKSINCQIFVNDRAGIASSVRILGPGSARIDYATSESYAVATIELGKRLSDDVILNANNGRSWFGIRDLQLGEHFHASDIELLESVGHRHWFEGHNIRYTNLDDRLVSIVNSPQGHALLVFDKGNWFSSWNGKTELRSAYCWLDEERVMIDSLIDREEAKRILEEFVLRKRTDSLVRISSIDTK